VHCGFDQASGRGIAVMMTDSSDDPEDRVRFFKEDTTS